MPASVNRLAGQASPYLAAHAEDPVDWYPWGPEPFERARELDRPVFVSIGYASCHWCHVMHRESFRDPAVADYMNSRFVSVKIDRELRPDVDHVYMTYLQLATGHGGWPLSVFVTPAGAPFFGGTYFPGAEARAGLPSFRDVLESVAEGWTRDRRAVDAASSQATEMLEVATQPRSPRPIDARIIDEGARRIMDMEDERHGGIGSAPKFPQLSAVSFLTAYAAATGEQRPLDVAERWVYAMLRSGTYDQAGGGLFRYSTDESWLVPHFEKMLYDNGQLLSAVAAIYELRPSDELAHEARRTAAFLERDLASQHGGLDSSLDADTEGIEGGTYTWGYDELKRILAPPELALAERRLGVTETGNWEGTNVLTRREGRLKDADEVDAVLVRVLDERTRRPQPARITNRLTDWNALAARGLVEAGVAIGDDSLVSSGTDLVDWLAGATLRGERVVHAVGDDSVDDVDMLADYAALALAAHSAAGASGRRDLAELAGSVTGWALGIFSHGGLVRMAGPDPVLPIAPVQTDDSPTPSGLSMLAEAYCALRPGDPSGAAGMLANAYDLATRAPYMAGHTLSTALSCGAGADAGRTG